MRKIIKIFSLMIICSLLLQNQSFAKSVYSSQYIHMNKKLFINNNTLTNSDIRLEELFFSKEFSDYSFLVDENKQNEIVLDSKGNRINIDSFNIQANSTNEINYKTSLKLSKVDYQLNPTKITNDYSKVSDDIKQYLLPSYRIESDNIMITQKAKELRNNIELKNRDNPYFITKEIFNYILTNMRFSLDKTQSNKGALFASKYLVGVCEDYADYMVALLRANNIPARTVYGFKISSSQLNNDPTTLPSAHMWVEVYFKEYGWVFFDPTMSKDNIENISFQDDSGKTVKISVYSSSYINDSTFGKMNNGYYYAKLMYDYGNLSDKLTSTHNQFSMWLNISINKTKNPYLRKFKTITLQKDKTINPNNVYFKVIGITEDTNETFEIDNSLIKWTFDNLSIGNMGTKGILSLYKVNGNVTVNAEFDGLKSSMNLSVNGFKN